MALLKETLKATGKVNFKLFDKDGNLKEDRTVQNLVVTAGLEYIAARMKETGRPNQMSHMAIGTSDTAAALGQEVLGTEVQRVGLETAGGTVSGASVTYTAVFPAGTSGAIREAGIFNDDGTPSGTMLCRTTFLVVTKGIDDTLAVTWEITFS